jgi:hypothetical protein
MVDLPCYACSNILASSVVERSMHAFVRFQNAYIYLFNLPPHINTIWSPTTVVEVVNTNASSTIPLYFHKPPEPSSPCLSSDRNTVLRRGWQALPSFLSALFYSSSTSTLFSLFKKLLSLTGLALCEPPAAPGLMLLLPLPPWLAMPRPGEERWGMFSRRGC